MIPSNPLSAFAAIAESQLGTQEDQAHTNRGTAILKYQQSTSLEDQGWPWCAAFVDWCVEQFIEQFPSHCDIKIGDRPQTASAFEWEDWGKNHHCQVFTDPAKAERGDVIIYTFSHIGIVSSASPRLQTIEGNTNPAGGRDGYVVALKDRTAFRQSIKCFVRLPARSEP